MDLNQEELDDLYTLFPHYTQHEVKDTYHSSNMDFRKTCFILIRKTNKTKKNETLCEKQHPSLVQYSDNYECLGELNECLTPFVIEIYWRGDTRHSH